MDATYVAYSTALGEHLTKDPFGSIGWLIRTAQSGDEAGAEVLANAIGMVAEPLDEEGNATPIMLSLYNVLYALDMYDGSHSANRTLSKLHADGLLAAHQVAHYMKNETPSPPMPQA